MAQHSGCTGKIVQRDVHRRRSRKASGHGPHPASWVAEDGQSRCRCLTRCAGAGTACCSVPDGWIPYASCPCRSRPPPPPPQEQSQAAPQSSPCTVPTLRLLAKASTCETASSRGKHFSAPGHWAPAAVCPPRRNLPCVCCLGGFLRRKGILYPQIVAIRPPNLLPRYACSSVPSHPGIVADVSATDLLSASLCVRYKCAGMLTHGILDKVGGSCQCWEVCLSKNCLATCQMRQMTLSHFRPNCHGRLQYKYT